MVVPCAGFPVRDNPVVVQVNPAGVMVVEDEAVVRLDLVKTLEGMQYRIVCEACNGDEAVKSARELRPDIVLMDICIPGTVNGIGAARVIREELDIPVVFVTASCDDATLDAVKAVSPYGYIVKPFRDRDIRVALELALSRKSDEITTRPSPMPALAEGTSVDGDSTGPFVSLSNIRALFVRGFFREITLLVYGNADIKEEVFTTFIERNIDSGGELLFAYSQSRAHRNVLPAIQNGKIRVCRIRSGDLTPVKEILDGIPAFTGMASPVPLKILIDISGEISPAGVRGVVERVMEIRNAGVPVSGIIAVSSAIGDDALIRDLSRLIPVVVASTGTGTLISCRDPSFHPESLSFLSQTVVDETVKKVLEPVVLSLLQKAHIRAGYPSGDTRAL